MSVELLISAGVVGLAVSLSPLTIMAIFPLLASERGVARGAALLVGWMASLALVLLVPLLIATSPEAYDHTPTGPDDYEAAMWVEVVRIALALLLLALAVRKVRRRRSPDYLPSKPGWIATLETASGPRVVLIGFALGAANPKVIAIAAAGASGLTELATSASLRAAATVTFVAVGSLTVLVPLLLAALLGERATPALGRMREWFERNEAYVVGALFVAIAAKLVSSAVGG